MFYVVDKIAYFQKVILSKQPREQSKIQKQIKLSPLWIYEWTEQVTRKSILAVDSFILRYILVIKWVSGFFNYLSKWKFAYLIRMLRRDGVMEKSY